MNNVPLGERRVQKRTVSDGASSQQVWKYDYSSIPGSTIVTDPNGNDTVHSFGGNNFGAGCALYETETDYFVGTHVPVSTSGQCVGLPSAPTLVKSVLTQYKDTGEDTLIFGLSAKIPSQTETVWNNGQVSQSVFNYDFNNTWTDENVIELGGPATAIPLTHGNLISQADYDYGQCSPGPLVRTATNGYEWIDDQTGQYVNANLISFPSSVLVTDGSGHEASNVLYGYDEAGLGPAGIHGNNTSITRDVNASSKIRMTTAYNAQGMPTSSTDFNGNPNGYVYDSTGVFLSNVTQPATNGVQHVDSYTWDANTGNLSSHTDQNGVLTRYSYNDSLYRLTLIDSAVGTAQESTTAYTYPSTTEIDVAQDKASSGDGIFKSSTSYDGLGRSIKTVANDGSVVETAYDGLGRVCAVSNPSSTDPGPLGCLPSQNSGTAAVTYFAYDMLGRKSVQTQPDQTALQWCYNGNPNANPAGSQNGSRDGSQTNCTANKSTRTGQSWVDLSDETGRHWQQVSDALGRLTSVMEPDSTNTPSLETDYQYDALGNLLSVNQAGTSGETPHERNFTYDALSRLLCASNPENSTAVCPASPTESIPSGTVSYSYDSNGNVVSKTDARGIRIQYCYDQLNRLLSKSSVDGSCPPNQASANPYALFVYDAGAAYGLTGNQIGRLAASANSASQTPNSAATLYSYDPLGRISLEAFITPGSLAGHASGGPGAYGLQPQYDLAGNLSQLTYPDDRVVTQTYSPANQLSGITFKSYNGQTPSPAYNYLASASYWPNGAVNNMTFGNGASETFSLNSRLQTSEIKVTGAPPGIVAPTLADRTYMYTASCPTGGQANNGNILQINDVLNSARTQFFCYDNLNRLSSALIADQSYQQMLNYDSFGNIKSATGTVNFVRAGGPKNQITDPGYQYDSAGNLTQVNPGILSAYAYDEEDRLTSFNNGAATYVYDGEGNRIRKNVGNDWTEYIYWNGQQLAETHPDGTWSDYIFANGKRIARADNYDTRLHMSGVNAQSCSGQYFSLGILAVNAYPNVIQPGDTLNFRQYSSGPAALGGVALYMSSDFNSYFEPIYDTDGQNIGADTIMNAWHYRTIDLTPYAGYGLGSVRLLETGGAPAGQFDLYFNDLSVTSKDGTVLPVFSKTPGVYIEGGIVDHPECVSNFNVVDETSASPAEALSPKDTTTYYHGDQIGSARLLTAGGGWAVWSGTYTPFGQEINPAQINPPNSYKFTGKERDEEEGSYLDYFGARYYSSAMGRFMSPDWSERPQPVPYVDLENPQTLNLYGYAGNNPVSHRDLDGHAWDCGATTGSTDPVGDLVVNGNCHDVPDWFDFPGWAFTGFANVLYGNPSQGAKEMAFGYAGQIAVGAVGSLVGEVIEGMTVISESGDTVVVQRVMSRAELEATEKTGLLRGGREGTHFVTDSAPDSAAEAQRQLALPNTPEIKVTMEVPKSAVSSSEPVGSDFGQPGGGTQRTATGQVPVKIISVKDLNP